MNPICDVVIVGAGVVGCSAAFHLTQAGKPRVIVVEKGSIASGMSKRSASLIHTHFASEPTAQLAMKSLEQFKNWKNVVGGDCGWKETGLTVAVHGEKNAENLRKRVEQLRTNEINAQILSPDELRELQPSARVEDLSLAAYEPDAGFVDAVSAAQAYSHRARDLGVKFKTGTYVKSIRTERGRVIGVETNAGMIEAPTVVVMAGPWSDRLLKSFGHEIGIKNERKQVVFFDRPAVLRAGHSAYLDFTTGAYFRPHTFGLTLAGWMDETSIVTNPDQFEETVSAEYVDAVRQRVAARLPAMANAKFIRGHAGIFDSSPDGNPALGNIPGVSGLLVAAGFSGIGVCLAPAVGRAIAEQIVFGSPESADLTPFRITRFKENQLLKSQLDYSN